MKTFLVRLSTAKKVSLGIVILLLGWGAYRLWFAPKSVSYQLATAARGTITQIVSVTGNTKPVHDVDLAFENGGTVAAVNYEVGDHVNAGAVIASLNVGDLRAQLAEAQANVDAQTAKLRSLQAGSRPEDIQAAQAALGKAQQDLTNMYANVDATLSDAYAKANDAVRNQLSPFFSGAETSNPQLTFMLSNSQTLNNIQFERGQVSTEFNNWQGELVGLSASSPTSTLDLALQKGAAHLSVINALFITAAEALVEQTGLPAATVNAYKTAVTTALTEINSATTNVSGAAQNIVSQKITIQGLQADANKAIAGPTANDIQAQEAQVEQAQASMQSIQVKITKASLVAPLSGVVTMQNAKVGEIAAPGVALVSLISDQGLEVDAQISEADIGKVSKGNPASMTLDAFQGQTFSGRVTYIDPGETVIEGVPTYKTTFQFDNLGPDVKPGMTANIDITTAEHRNVIYIPQRAVTTNTDGTRTVQVYHGANQPLEARKVAVGIRDTEGNIEIISGLNEGEIVVARPSS